MKRVQTSAIIILTWLFFNNLVLAQPVPAGDENIPYLMTFGPKAETSWGDDDYSQTFFFLIPEEFNSPIFIRVFDPDVGGAVDEVNVDWDTKMTYSVYGGNQCYTHDDAQETDPKGNYKSGNLLGTKIFGVNPRYDNNWYTFGPFNPTEGEYVDKFKGHVFKIICEGVTGDDGNMYQYYLSTAMDKNLPIEGGNAFAYEYSFRMHNDPNEVSHIYPYVDDRTLTIKLSNFDWDNDGFIRTVSVARQGQMSKVSGEDSWVEDEFKIMDEEKNTSLDIQFIKRKNPPVKNNNVVVNVRNQYGELLPFFTIPIGGVPKYKYNIGVKKAK
ncbi:MAG: hypothetical protein GVY19_08340 [Bacteroidetes bacterium]|jgi:hypothetical protein|nr:hypothetical protein [Bacteroidota bacterium]